MMQVSAISLVQAQTLTCSKGAMPDKLLRGNNLEGNQIKAI